MNSENHAMTKSKNFSSFGFLGRKNVAKGTIVGKRMVSEDTLYAMLLSHHCEKQGRFPSNS
jgi:hypothetical protein